jgi:tRNA (guanine26-N2/guanine27-N2)-dimethyltransferase
MFLLLLLLLLLLAVHTSDEQELEDPFYLTANKMFGTIHASSAPTTKVLSALLNGGYKVSRSHAAPGSIKTNAPCSFIYDIVREHVKENPVRMDKIPEKSPSRYALLKPMTYVLLPLALTNSALTDIES